MKTIRFLNNVYAVQVAVGLPEGTVILQDAANMDLVRLHNLVASNLEELRVNRFTDHKVAVRRTWEILERFDATAEKAEPAAPEAVEAPTPPVEAENAPSAAPAARAGTKMERLLDLLKTPDGVSLAEVQNELGWLPHTTRASISTAAKKGLIAKPQTEKVEGRGTVYRVAA